MLTLCYFFTVVSFFNAEYSVHDSMDGAFRVLGKQCVLACFTFEVDALLDAEGIGKMKQEHLDSLFKGGQPSFRSK